MRARCARLLRRLADKVDHGMCCELARSDRRIREFSEAAMRSLETTGTPQVQAHFKQVCAQRRLDRERMDAWRTDELRRS